MRLNLGCCDAHLSGYVNVDIAPPADELVNLALPWPWANSSIKAIRAHDIIEHLPDKIRTMNEAHRVLIPGGLLDIIVPTTDGPGAWQDPTHVSFWNLNSFLYYEEGRPERTRFAKYYGITAEFRFEGATFEKDWVGAVKLHIRLRAVK